MLILIINNSFTVKMLFWVMTDKGVYSIDTPMIPMFVESKNKDVLQYLKSLYLFHETEKSPLECIVNLNIFCL